MPKKRIRRSVARPKKTSKEYFLWCDESDLKGKYYSNFYGGVLVSSVHLKEVHTRLLHICNKLRLKDEIKWHKVSSHYVGKYQSLMDVFFTLLKENKVKVRIMFRQNAFVATHLLQTHKDEEFFILYYQFIKHAFGFAHSKNEGDTFVRIYFDYLPDTVARRQVFKEYIRGLQSNREFQLAGIKIRKQDIAEVDSKRHLLLQMIDVVLGSICFRLNDKHKEIPEGKKRRGKRTIAKEKLYRYINKKIREIRPNFNVGANTGISKITDYWQHSYRHWNFKPANFKIDETLFK